MPAYLPKKGPRREMSALLDHCPHSVALATEETVKVNFLTTSD